MRRKKAKRITLEPNCIAVSGSHIFMKLVIKVGPL